MSRFLLTGGNGFIGHNITKQLLSQDHEVWTYDADRCWIPETDFYQECLKRRLAEVEEEKVNRIKGCTTNEKLFRKTLEEFDPEFIIHLAGLPLANHSNKNVADSKETILDGTENVLRCVAERGSLPLQRFTFISSSMIYGDFDTYEGNAPIPARETDRLDPQKSLYAAYKACGETMTRAFGYIFDIPWTIVRPSAVYGPFDVNERVTGIFMKNAFTGAPLMLKNKGQTELDFTFVEDTAKGIILATTSDKGIKETFNITAGNGRSLEELAHVIQELAPSAKIEYDDSQDIFRPKRGTLDITKARRLLGYNPEHSIETGFAKYAETMRQLKTDGVI